MNCKNCGTQVVPGALRCPTCNVEYAKSDALDIPVIPTESLLEPVLPDDINEEITIGNIKIEDQEKTFNPNEIIPIEMPKPTEVTIPIVNEIHDEITTENQTVEKKSGLLPEERGGNKLFLIFGIIILLVGVSFGVYAKFINPKIVDEIIYYFKPELRPIEKEDEEIVEFEKTVLKYSDLKEYMQENASYDLLTELITQTFNSIKSIQLDEEIVELIVYKETNENLEIIKDAEKKLNEILKKYTINDTFEINVFEAEKTIQITFECVTEVSTPGE